MKNLPVIIFVFFSSLVFSQDQQAKLLMKKMLDACDAVKSARFVLKSAEKELNGKIQESEMIIKMQTSPLKIYLYMIRPHAGAECLWRNGEISNRVLVNPNGFPYINLKLGLYNSLLRQDSHHLVSELGFEYLASMTKYYQNKMGDSFFNYLKITDTLQWDNRTCYELTFDYTPFQYSNYTVKLNETLTTIGNQFHISDYVLLHHNPKVKDYDAIQPGQVIQVPNFYNRKVALYVDRNTFLPLVQITYDEKGLLEKYEMKSFVLNPGLQPEEFTASYSAYGF
ncbi:MAG: LysM peptidoglycan-binding domain-containing protein [Bacteroidetes bacterium]|nr:LysM peptidoglycan-binding domain-containing protein [Bacteroidota bacterium]